MVINLWKCLRASSGRGLCLLRSVASLYTEHLGVPGLPGPHSSWLSCLLATRFPLCGCPLFSLAEEVAHWRYPPFLSCPKCVRFPSTLLLNGLFTRPGFFGILSGSKSPGLSSTAFVQASSSGASRSARKRSSASSPSGQSGKTGKNHQDKSRFFISWRLRPLRRSKESAG